MGSHPRKCIGCYETKEKSTLIRIIMTGGGAYAIDRTQKAQTRGAYICPDPGCIEKARKKRSAERSFGVYRAGMRETAGALDKQTNSIYETLKNYISDDTQGGN